MCAWCACAGRDVPRPSSDTRAELLLDIMLGTLQQQAEAPNLAHLLLGFDIGSSPAQWYYQELQPQHDYSCLSVLLNALQVCVCRWMDQLPHRFFSVNCYYGFCALASYMACSSCSNRQATFCQQHCQPSREPVAQPNHPPLLSAHQPARRPHEKTEQRLRIAFQHRGISVSSVHAFSCVCPAGARAAPAQASTVCQVPAAAVLHC